MSIKWYGPLQQRKNVHLVFIHLGWHLDIWMELYSPHYSQGSLINTSTICYSYQSQFLLILWVSSHSCLHQMLNIEWNTTIQLDNVMHLDASHLTYGPWLLQGIGAWMENKRIMHLITKKAHSKHRMAHRIWQHKQSCGKLYVNHKIVPIAKLSSKIPIYTSTPEVRCMHIAYAPSSRRKAIHSH